MSSDAVEAFLSYLQLSPIVLKILRNRQLFTDIWISVMKNIADHHMLHWTDSLLIELVLVFILVS